MCELMHRDWSSPHLTRGDLRYRLTPLAGFLCKAFPRNQLESTLAVEET